MEKVINVLKKLYTIRFKVSKKDTPILNWSALFTLACVIFAPHMSIIGALLALLLGYQMSVDVNGEGFESENLESTLRNAAQNVKSTVANAALAVKTEMDQAKMKKEAGKTAEKETEAPTTEAPKADAQPAPQREAEPVSPADTPDPFIHVVHSKPVNADVLEDLQQHTEDFTSNPAATTYRSAYTASADSVPTIQFPEADSAEDTASPAHGHMG